MNTCCTAVRLTAFVINSSGNFRPSRLLAWLVMALLAGSLLEVRAVEPDVKYLRIYYAIEKADLLAKDGQVGEAKSKYLEAQAGLKDLKAMNPTWNTKAVAYRLSYVTEKLDSLSKSSAISIPETAGIAESAVKSGALPAGMQAKLLSPGDEPRQALRLLVKPGDTQTAVMTLQVAMDLGEAGGVMKVPAIKVSLGLESKSVATDGDINCEMRFEDINVSADAGDAAPMVEAMKTAMAGIKGMTIMSVISDRGDSKQVEVKLPPDADATVRQSMDQMKDSIAHAQFLLPEEPVGPGARWEVKQKLKAQGMTIDQTTTYYLVSVAGNILTLESSQEQSAANQKITSPAMPQAKVDLKKMTGTTKAQLTVDLTKVLATEGTINGSSELAVNAGSGAQAQSMKLKTELKLKIESK